MIKNQAFLKFALIASFTVAFISCTSKEVKYSETIQYAESFLQIPYDEDMEYQKTFYTFMDPTLSPDITKTWLHGMFIPWGKDPRSIIELKDVKVKKDKDFKLFTMKFTITRVSEHRCFDYQIDVKETPKKRSIINFIAIEHQIAANQ